MSDVFHRLHQDAGERTTTFEVVQDVEPYLERNKAIRDLPQKSDWGRRVAYFSTRLTNAQLQSLTS